MRVGQGYDIHQLEAGRPLILGGVTIPFHKGLKGHSDGDTLLHAITDALLGAVSLGDIGKHFPDTDPQFKNADSSLLLADVWKKVQKKGWRLANLDATIIAQAPKLSEFIGSMRGNLARILNVDVEQVSVKAKTNEHLDALGRQEGIAVHAVVLLEEMPLR